MSFSVLPDDDPQMTLQAALAFINACEGGYGSASSSAADEDEGWIPVAAATTAVGDEEARSPGSQRAHTQSAAAKSTQPEPSQSFDISTTSRRARRARSVSKHRERKKRELLCLREQAALLERRLIRLQHRKQEPGSAPGSQCARNALLQARVFGGHVAGTSSLSSVINQVRNGSNAQLTWQDVAGIQERARLQSEMTNTNLREALKRQMMTNKSLDGLLHKKLTEGSKLLAEYNRSDLCPSGGDLSLKTIERSEMQRLHADALDMHQMSNAVVGIHSEVIKPRSTVAMSSLQKGVDSSTGLPYSELQSTTAIGCNFLEAGLKLWDGSPPQIPSSRAGNNTYTKLPVTSSSFQKIYRIFPDNYSDHSVEIRGYGYMHKFEETDRFSYTYTSTITVSNNGPTFTDRTWVVAVPCRLPEEAGCYGTDAGEWTFAKTYSRIACVSLGDDPSSRMTQELVPFCVNMLSEKTRYLQERVQEDLLSMHQTQILNRSKQHIASQ